MGMRVQGGNWGTPSRGTDTSMLLGRALPSTSGESVPCGGSFRVLMGRGFWDGSCPSSPRPLTEARSPTVETRNPRALRLVIQLREPELYALEDQLADSTSSMQACLAILENGDLTLPLLGTGAVSRASNASPTSSTGKIQAALPYC